MITGILVALPEELHTLTSATLTQGECLSVAENTLVILSGAGIENAEQAAQVLIDKGAQQLMSWGCAGALSPDLNAGDLVIPATIITHNSIELTPHSVWAKQIISTLEPLIKCYNGKLFESSSIISLASDKAEQYQHTQALAVDMESAAVARIALQAQLPFVAIRSIVDPAHLDLPQAISHAMTDTGVVALPKLMLYLLGNPTELPRLIKLGLHFKAATKTLKKVAALLPQITQVV